MIQAAFFSLVTNLSAVKAIVGSRKWLYPGRIPQDARLPAAGYQVITTSQEHNHDGPSQIRGPLVQLTIDAETYDGAWALASAIRKGIDGYSGIIGSVQICGIFNENEYGSDNLTSGVQTVRQDYTINWKEVNNG